MIPDCDGRSDGQTVRRSDGQTESIIANTALCIARAMLTRCKNSLIAFLRVNPCEFLDESDQTVESSGYLVVKISRYYLAIVDATFHRDLIVWYSSVLRIKTKQSSPQKS